MAFIDISFSDLSFDIFEGTDEHVIGKSYSIVSAMCWFSNRLKMAEDLQVHLKKFEYREQA